MQLSDTLENAVQLHQAGRHQEAEKGYRQILAQQPDHADANHLLGLLALQGKFFQEAIQLISTAISADGAQAMYHNSLGLCLKEIDQNTQAIESFKKAITLSPHYAEAQSNLALVYLAMRQPDLSVKHFLCAKELDPDNLDTLGNLGNAHRDAGDWDAAIACYRQLIKAQPLLPQAYGQLGIVLQEQEHFDDAITAYKKAISIDKGYLEAHNNLGLAFQYLGRLEDAANQFLAALAVNPEFAEAHSNLGVVLQQQGAPDQALKHLEKAIVLAPDQAKAHSNLGTVMLELGHAEKSVACFQKALELKSRFPTAHSNLLLGRLYLAHTDTDENLALARQINSQLPTADRHSHRAPNDKDQSRCLNIGFVSSDLRRHAVSSFLESVWAELKSEHIKIFAYATSRIEDDVTERLKKIVTAWRNIAGLPLAHKARRISEDNIDILIDLGGHTAQNNLDVFALKPAPIQVSWLGYSATTGLEGMDYILGDPWVTPPEDADQYTEKIWHLPNSYLCFSPPDIPLHPSPTPALHQGHITFGTFNNLTKLTDQAIACWTAILNEIPESHLLLKAKQLDYPAFRADILARFQAQGIASQRINLLEKTPGMEAHFSTYNLIDIALDPFPYAGTTTTSEALWMGVPVLSLKGDRFVARVGESLLRNTGLDDWIADSEKDLIHKARKFSADIPALNKLRQTIRPKFVKSPVCDAPLFAKNMSAAFRGMWEKWCAE